MSQDAPESKHPTWHYFAAMAVVVALVLIADLLLELALEHGADFIGLSFVRGAQEIWAARALIPKDIRIYVVQTLAVIYKQIPTGSL